MSATGYGALVSPSLNYAGPDQGIDFTGKGSIYAPGRLKITRVDLHSGWPGGHIIVGQLLDGPRKGRYVYFAEALNPVSGLKAGDTVDKGAKIANLNSSYPGTEIGWARDASGTAYGTTHDGKSGGPTPSHGLDFRDFIQAVTLSGGGNAAQAAIHSGPDESLSQTLKHPEFADTASNLAKNVIDGLASAFAKAFGPAFLYFALVASGAALVVMGAARTAGVKPADVAKTVATRGAKK